jgi:uroporphyrin-III C-methyltransferase
MELDLTLRGRRVLIIGGATEARRSIARYLAAEATVYLAAPDGASATSRLQVVEYPTTTQEWTAIVSAVDVVALVGADERTDRIVTAACHARKTWLSREPAASAVGSVTLVGGGPGDEGLLTLAGREALRHADVIYYDRLAPHSNLAAWAPGAEFINVGKKPGHHAVPQKQIEEIMVSSALAGNNVVRLKGGDPFVFGRGGEEVLACREAGVPVTVIPGVTSAIAVPGAAGIPVTHRDLSHVVTVVSGHAPLTEIEFASLVGLGGTIVVLMGMTNLPHLAAGLVRHGMATDMPLAIIERGFSDNQRTTITTIDEAPVTASAVDAKSPAVLVIGAVVAVSGHEPLDLAALLHDSTALTPG